MNADTSPLIDRQGRRLDYLRLAVTDRCNLRCRYCMPADGVPAVAHDDILRFEELVRLVRVLGNVGVGRVRITGGEPLVRRGVTDLIAALADLPHRPEILLTTNGVHLADHLPALVRAGLRRVNLSLDTLDAGTWRRVTRRQGFAAARGAVDAVLAAGLELKLNVVVLPGVNDHELPAFLALTRDLPLTVRFIEAMGFDGSGQPVATLDGDAILARLRGHADLVAEPRAPGAVAEIWTVAGHAGRVGLVRGHSRTFCGDCSRLRVDPRGRLRTCLYGEPAADLGACLRRGADDAALLALIRTAVAQRRPDGFAAASARLDSMANIGG